MKPLNYLLLLALIVLGCRTGFAQFSFVYLQGDKQTPFYVKLEGEMLPRYGKNYCIIPRLAPGPINLEILFQQNVHPPQKFIVQVPDHGHRGFLLTKTADGFSLYDLQQHFYLHAGNTAAEDHAPAPKPAAVASAEPGKEEEEAPAMAATPAPEPDPRPAATKEKKKSVPRNNPLAPKTPRKKAEATTARQDGPVFLDDIELNSNHDVQPGEKKTASPRTADEDVAGAEEEPTTVSGIRNSDCPGAMEPERFERIYKNSLKKESEEERLQYLGEQFDECYSTKQVELLAKSLDTEAGRYVYLKRVYSRITDQGAFARLISLFNTEEYKTAFKELSHP